MIDLLSKCNICPRNCNVNRLNGELGFCHSDSNIKLSKVYLHKWEEPCISGRNGSGTIFFSNCSLRCCFCQNHKISHEGFGKEVSIDRLSEIFIEQQARGAHNINLVTPTHYVPQIISAIEKAKAKGLTLPILYNSSGYEKEETIKLLKGYIDVYLPDIKYYNNKYAVKYSNAPDYFSYAESSVKEMVSQVGEVKLDENGMIKSGVIIRHMMLPGLLFDSKKIIDFIIKNFGDSVYVSIMNQYTPMFNAKNYPEINKTLKAELYDSLIDYALSAGVNNGFIQESGTSSETYVPDFNLSGI